MHRIGVYCGSRMGNSSEIQRSAYQLGQSIGRRGWTLVYGGGGIGLMKLVADGVLEAGGQIIGVIPQMLVDRELAHKQVQDMRIVQSMHERKKLMADLATGFLALPGGFGTLDELCEIVTWSQLGLHQKPIVLLNWDGFYDEFIRFFEKMVQHDFMHSSYLKMIKITRQTEEALEIMSTRSNTIK